MEPINLDDHLKRCRLCLKSTNEGNTTIQINKEIEKKILDLNFKVS